MGATGLKCNFFSSNLQRSLWRKKKGACRPPNGRQAPVAHPRGDRTLSPVGGATGSCRPAHERPPLGPAHRRGRGPVVPPAGDRGPVAPPLRATGVPPYKRADPPLPSSFEPENSTKNPEKKKRGVRRRKAAKPCRIQHL